MTGDDNPQQQGMGWFNMGGMNMGGINIEDLMGGFGGFNMGGGQRRGGGQQRGGQKATYTFSFNGGEGMRF